MQRMNRPPAPAIGAAGYGMRGENLTSKAPKFIRLLAIYLHKNVIGLSEADGTILNAPILLKIPGTVGWARTTDLLFHRQAL